MDFVKALMVIPLILFMVVVAPIWITMHYKSLNKSSASLNAEDREAIEDILVTVDKLTERIETLESILDADHPQWRAEQARREESI